MSHNIGATALENKHSGLLFEVVMLLYTSSEDLVISPYSTAVSLHVFHGSSHFCLELSSRVNWLDSVINGSARVMVKVRLWHGSARVMVKVRLWFGSEGAG